MDLNVLVYIKAILSRLDQKTNQQKFEVPLNDKLHNFVEKEKKKCDM